MSFKVLGIYADGMVLQRNTTNCIFGKGEPGVKVELAFRELSASATVDAEGKWKIEYNPGQAGGPFEVKLTSGSDSITFKDVWVGEVWVSSGQSNAQLPMDRLRFSYPYEMKLPKDNNIRMITIPITWSYDGEKDSVENPEWIPASPETIAQMSGTGYFFAKNLSSELGLPVGIINASQGGSPITSWMSEDSLKELGKTNYLEQLNKWRQGNAVKNQQEKEMRAGMEWQKNLDAADTGSREHWENLSYEQIADDSYWKDCFIPNNFFDLKEGGVCWFKKEIDISAEELAGLTMPHEPIRLWLGVIVESDKAWVNGVYCGETGYCYPPRRYVIPQGVLHEGKNTITVRVVKTNQTPIRFYEDKTYAIFTSKERISLDGEWKKRIACDAPNRPGSTFFEWQPTALYNAMLAPCFNYAVAGALWYQGESNTWGAFEYADLLKKMIETWRAKFVYAAKNMPVVVIQLPKWGDGYKDEQRNFPEDWAWLRQAQFDGAAAAGNAALAPMIDAGEWNDLHPEDKIVVGERAAREALRIAYGRQTVPAPVVKSCKVTDNKVVVQFDQEVIMNNSELVGVEGLYFVGMRQPDAAPSGLDKNSAYAGGDHFSLPIHYAGMDSLHIKAKGTVTGPDTMEVEIPSQIKESGYPIKELRYLWTNCPEFVTLYSKSGLPVMPFIYSLPSQQ